MKILAIETSCDDTGIAVLEAQKDSFKVLSNIVSSQQIHQQYGGVFPFMAQREHQKNLVPVMVESLSFAKLLAKKEKILEFNDSTVENILKREPELLQSTEDFLKDYKKPKVDAIAVAYGPGLEPCLWTGVNFARALSYYWNIPLIPVNHIEGHILVNYLENANIEFPALSLVVSGGHTQLIVIKSIGAYKIVGETRDDAAGECFDKCAKMLNLGYPGGPIISKHAEHVKESNIKLPRPMLNTKDYDFSFSGLKTAVLYETKGKKLTKDYVSQMSFQVQQSIIDVLIKKTIQAAKDFKVKTVMLGGGVSANKELRKQLGEKVKEEMPHVKYIIPDAKLSTDNGVMIAITAYFNQKKTASWKNLKADANLRVGR